MPTTTKTKPAAAAAAPKRSTRSSAPAAAVRPKELYRKDKPPKKPADKENNAGSSIESLNRRQLQARAIEAGIKANGTSADIRKALEAMDANAGKGFNAFMKTAGMDMMSNNWTKPDNVKDAEREELADLAFLGIAGRTPGGTRWRNKAVHNTKKGPPPPMVSKMPSVDEAAEVEI